MILCVEGNDKKSLPKKGKDFFINHCAFKPKESSNLKVKLIKIANQCGKHHTLNADRSKGKLGSAETNYHNYRGHYEISRLTVIDLCFQQEP